MGKWEKGQSRPLMAVYEKPTCVSKSVLGVAPATTVAPVSIVSWSCSFESVLLRWFPRLKDVPLLKIKVK